MAKSIDITNKTFGRLTVLRRVGNHPSGKTQWECLCKCGKKTVVITNCLTSGNTRSCGCFLKEHKQNFIDLTGRIFGSLTVIREFDSCNKREGAFWLCRCVCGKEKITAGGALRRGYIKSCGCLTRHYLSINNNKRSHGLTNSPEFKTWDSMHLRCKSFGDKCYHLYGARGITVCERWRKFENFYADMGPRPTPKHTIERVDNDKGYDPSNCIWADRKVQARNTRRNHVLEFQGVKKPIVEWAETFQLHPQVVLGRIISGWSVEQALTQPVRSRKPNRASNLLSA